MEILVLGKKSKELEWVFSKAGHSVRNQPLAKHYKIVEEIRKSKPERVISSEHLSQNSLEYLKGQGVGVWGTSAWSRALDVNPSFHGLMLKELESPGLKIDGGSYRFTLEGWWDGTSYHFSWWYVHKKKLFNDDIGPEVESGWVLGKPLRGRPRITELTLDRLKPILTKVGYKGPVSLRLSLDNGDLSVISLQAKILFDPILALAELFRDPVQLLGQSKLRYSNLFVAAIRAALFGGLENPQRIELDHEAARPHVALSEDGRVASVTARGLDVTETRRRCYRTMRNLVPTDVGYRSDLSRGFGDLEGELSCLGLL